MPTDLIEQNFPNQYVLIPVHLRRNIQMERTLIRAGVGGFRVKILKREGWTEWDTLPEIREAAEDDLRSYINTMTNHAQDVVSYAGIESCTDDRGRLLVRFMTLSGDWSEYEWVPNYDPERSISIETIIEKAKAEHPDDSDNAIWLADITDKIWGCINHFIEVTEIDTEEQNQESSDEIRQVAVGDEEPQPPLTQPALNSRIVAGGMEVRFMTPNGSWSGYYLISRPETAFRQTIPRNVDNILSEAARLYNVYSYSDPEADEWRYELISRINSMCSTNQSEAAAEMDRLIELAENNQPDIRYRVSSDGDYDRLSYKMPTGHFCEWSIWYPISRNEARRLEVSDFIDNIQRTYETSDVTGWRGEIITRIERLFDSGTPANGEIKTSIHGSGSGFGRITTTNAQGARISDIDVETNQASTRPEAVFGQIDPEIAQAMNAAGEELANRNNDRFIHEAFGNWARVDHDPPIEIPTPNARPWTPPGQPFPGRMYGPRDVGEIRIGSTPHHHPNPFYENFNHPRISLDMVLDGLSMEDRRRFEYMAHTRMPFSIRFDGVFITSYDCDENNPVPGALPRNTARMSFEARSLSTGNNGVFDINHIRAKGEPMLPIPDGMTRNEFLKKCNEVLQDACLLKKDTVDDTAKRIVSSIVKGVPDE